MRQIVVGFLVMASVLPGAAAGSGRGVPKASPNHDAAIVGAPAGYDRPASDPLTTLGVHARCSASRSRAVNVTLAWEAKHQDVATVRVDVTGFRDGFQTGQFETVGERPVGDRRVELGDAAPGGHYYWRLLVRRPQGWAFAANGEFDAPVCPDDDAKERP